MPDDWMTEYRFAIAFFMFLYAYLVVVSRDFLRGLRLRRALSVGVASLLAVAFLGGSALLFGSRSIAFAQAPIVPFADVAGYMGRRFNRFAAALGVEDGSLLVPDTGGALYYSTLRVYDLGMLCDKTIARTMGKDQQAFYDYVFEVAKPTFIHVHGTWTLQADLDRDPRFRRDYVAIDEYVDTSVPGWGGLPRYSGDYVRKDMVGDKLEALRERPGARQTGAEAEAGEELRQGAWTAGREGWGPGRLPRSGAAGSGRWGGRRW
jgi:hypothetical protein